MSLKPTVNQVSICFFCKKDITKEQMDKGDAVIMKDNRNRYVGAHTYHHGVSEEYAGYVDRLSL